MKPLDRNPGISVGWIHEKIVEGSYNFIHTRTEHMSADIYTKSFTDFGLWQRLKMLINIYSPTQMAVDPWEPNPSNDDIFLPAVEGGGPLHCMHSLSDFQKYKCANPQYFVITRGLSTADDDLRKPIKQKSKAKAKPKAVPAANKTASSSSSGGLDASRTTKTTIFYSYQRKKTI
jgi:hypothetical protein